MTSAVRSALLTLSLTCAACNNEFVLLAQRPPEPLVDAGADDAQTADAEAPDDALAPQVDAASPPDAELPATDGGHGSYAVSGFAQTCALREGALYCWGADDSGQVGVLGDENRRSPVRVTTASFVDVCAGEHHSCALRNDGVAFCWGSNAHGELGVGDRNPREEPTEVRAGPFATIRCGGFNTCALTDRGKLWCWGDNTEGKLAQGDPPPSEPDTLALSTVPLAVESEQQFAEVSVGQGHVCALSDQGRLSCWGRNSVGQLGVSEALDQTRAPLPAAVDAKFRSIAAGQSHSCAVDTTGKLWCWGQTKGGLLGIESAQPSLRTPTRVAGDDYTHVTVNWLHSCALKQDHTLYCWGRGEEGQLGSGDSGPRSAPTQVGHDARWQSVNAGQFHTCAFADNALFCWGANDTGQLGQGDNARRYFPLAVPFP
ncbi:MAG TPA: hypothetical protein VI299_10195 [Polyangiales bacterium]